MIKISRFNSIDFLFIFITFLLWGSTSFAQDSTELSSPYHTIYNHLNNLKDNNYYPEQAANSFPSRFPLAARIEMARRLKMVYDAHGLEVNFSSIPKNRDYVDSLTLKSVYTPFPYSYTNIQLEKFNNGWVYTTETAIQIEGMYRETFPLWAESMIEGLPQVFHNKYLGVTGWQILGFVVLILLLILVNFVLSYIIDIIILRFVYHNEKLETAHSKLVYKIATYLSVVVMIYVFKYFVTKLLLPVNISKFILLFTDIVQTVIILLLLFYIISIAKIYLLRYTAKTENKLDDQLAPVFIKGLKIILGFIALLHILALVGVNITALIAGASIGGLALALAAQDTFKNMFGSVMVFLDKPFEIGDFIMTSEIEGTVDNVGLRSTRIRKIDTSIISVPNGNLANTTITNLGKRLNRILELNLGIRYSTSHENLNGFIALLRLIPDQHTEISPENKFIFLRNLASSSIEIYFRVYISAATFDEELAVRERIIFDIIKAAEKAGVSFAFPSTSVYLEPTEVTEKFLTSKKY